MICVLGVALTRKSAFGHSGVSGAMPTPSEEPPIASSGCGLTMQVTKPMSGYSFSLSLFADRWGNHLTIPSLHSFDVFGTSLVRTLAVPDHLFFLLAESVLMRREDDVSREKIRDLARTRIQAARSARRASDRDDIPLEEIYRHMDLESWGITTAEMIEEELRLEAESVRPVARTRAKLERLRREGNHVVFISDTPLPAAHLKKMLESAGMAHPDDRVYTSSEVGFTKSSGRLFDYVLEREGDLADGWVHHGDHPHSDVEVVQRLGIGAAPFFDARLSRYERILLAAGEEEGWIRSHIAGVSRVARLMAGTRTDDGGFPVIPELTAGVVAPLLTCFVAWVIREANRTGVERLYFVSRDGDILLQIVRELEKRMPVPECRYLYGSRQAWLLPAITSVDRSDLYWILDESPTLIDLLSKLSLDHVEVHHLLNDHGFSESDLTRRLGKDEIERFWEFVGHPDVSSLVLGRAEAARGPATAYLEQEGLTSPGRWALVDVGWKLRSQWALKRMLDTIGHGDAVAGYYLAVSHRRPAMAETGTYRALFMEEEHEDVKQLLSHAMVLEEAFLSADHGPVASYRWNEGRSMPVLQDWDDNPRRRRLLADLRRVVSIYAKEALDAGILEADLGQLRRGVLRVSHELLTRPTQEEAQTLGWITAVDDIMHDPKRQRQLAVPLGVRDVLDQFAFRNLSRLKRVRRYRDRPRRYFWLEGSLALSRPWIRLFFQLASRLRLKQMLLAPVRVVKRRDAASPIE